MNPIVTYVKAYQDVRYMSIFPYHKIRYYRIVSNPNVRIKPLEFLLNCWLYDFVTERKCGNRIFKTIFIL